MSIGRRPGGRILGALAGAMAAIGGAPKQAGGEAVDRARSGEPAKPPRMAPRRGRPGKGGTRIGAPHIHDARIVNAQRKRNRKGDRRIANAP